MVDTFPWQQRVFKVRKGENIGLVLNYRGKFLNKISKSNLFCYNLHTAVHQFGKLFENRSSRNESLSDELCIIQSFNPNIAIKRAVGN